MYPKRTVAVAVSILLLAVSSSASLCEISCSLSKPNPMLHLAKASSVARSQDRRTQVFHSHCGHTAASNLGGTPSHSFENISMCSNAPCAQAVALFSPMKGDDRAQMESPPLALLSLLPHPVRIDPLLLNSRCEAAPRKASPLDAPSIGLRI